MIWLTLYITIFTVVIVYLGMNGFEIKESMSLLAYHYSYTNHSGQYHLCYFASLLNISDFSCYSYTRDDNQPPLRLSCKLVSQTWWLAWADHCKTHNILRKTHLLYSRKQNEFTYIIIVNLSIKIYKVKNNNSKKARVKNCSFMKVIFSCK